MAARLIVLGRQGAGKGTQAQRLSQKLQQQCKRTGTHLHDLIDKLEQVANDLRVRGAPAVEPQPVALRRSPSAVM